MAFDRNKWKRERYRENPEPERERSLRYQRDHKEKIRGRLTGLTGEKQAYVDKVKDIPCVDCHNRFPVECMDLDHIRGEKRTDVSAMIHRPYSIQSVVEEVKKCEVVCDNCHRIRTRKRRLRASD